MTWRTNPQIYLSDCCKFDLFSPIIFGQTVQVRFRSHPVATRSIAAINSPYFNFHLWKHAGIRKNTKVFLHFASQNENDCYWVSLENKKFWKHFFLLCYRKISWNLFFGVFHNLKEISWKKKKDLKRFFHSDFWKSKIFQKKYNII